MTRWNSAIPTEDQEQAALVDWLQLHNILFTHVPNGGARDKVTGAILKRLGVSKGCPDILIFDRPPKAPECAGVAIELKRRKGGQIRPEQAEWLEKLKVRGWVADVCRGADDAIRLLEGLGFGKKGERTRR